MLGGIDTALFLKGLGGFFMLPIIILLLRWAFPTKKDPALKAQRKELKRSLRELKRK
jgi:hypothetical protein